MKIFNIVYFDNENVYIFWINKFKFVVFAPQMFQYQFYKAYIIFKATYNICFMPMWTSPILS